MKVSEMVRAAKDRPEKIASRKTADNKTVIFWSDGGVTSGMGGVPRGTSGVVHRDIQNWLMGDVSLYDWDELPKVIQLARKLHKKQPGAKPGDYRAFVGKVLGPGKDT
jgi:hypothetical protein